MFSKYRDTTAFRQLLIPIDNNNNCKITCLQINQPFDKYRDTAAFRQLIIPIDNNNNCKITCLQINPTL